MEASPREPSPGQPSPDFEELLGLLELEAVGGGRFRGGSPAARNRSIYGGQFVAQALVAAGRTVAGDRVPHSLHAYFLRAGDPKRPLEFTVESVRDGRSYHHRQVVIGQDGKEVFRMLAGFTVDQAGPHFQPADVADAAGAADPAAFPDYVTWTMDGTDNGDHTWPTEATPVEITFEAAPAPAFGQVVTGPQRMWLRLRGTVPSDDRLLHAALLAWLSDKTLSDLAILCHGHRWLDTGVTSVSLDHSMWFLEPARADGWLCFEQQAEHTAGGRGLVRGRFVTPDGRQIASVAQEAVVDLSG